MNSKINRLLSLLVFILYVMVFSIACVACSFDAEQFDPNQLNPMQLKTYAGDCQIVHPKVLYFADNLFGYKYWMSYTPYPNANIVYENPCIAYSNDGYKWLNINSNPIADKPTKNKMYNSDANLVYRDDLGILECWYREYDEINKTEKIYRKVSNDGFVWRNHELLYSIEGMAFVQLMSPSIIYEDNFYKIWVVAYDQPRYVIKYYESETGVGWQEKRTIDLSYCYEKNLYDIWHIDVVKIQNNYNILAMVKGTDKWMLFLTDSKDNKIYNEPYAVLLPSQNGWDMQLYRACLVQVNEKYLIYYSARNSALKYGLGIAISDNLYEFEKIERIA